MAIKAIFVGEEFARLEVIPCESAPEFYHFYRLVEFVGVPGPDTPVATKEIRFRRCGDGNSEFVLYGQVSA